MPSRYLNLDQLISLEQSAEGQLPSHNILDSIADGIFAVDRQWQIISFNRAAEKLTGFSRDEVLGQPCHTVFRCECPCGGCPLTHSLRSGESTFNHQLCLTNQHNSRLEIAAKASPVFNEIGEIIGVVETLRPLVAVLPQRAHLTDMHNLEGIYSCHPGIHGIFSVLPDIAQSNAPLLIRGESGTGKEHFARAVHQLSSRSNEPLVMVNCGALPEAQLELKIFGEQPDCLTADADQPGLLNSARAGTLLLDEIGDLPLSVQAKLLHLIETSAYNPSGSTASRVVDVRLIATTQYDLVQRVAEGRFRRDLYFRLNVIGFSIPPLRERHEDVPLLLDLALKRHCHTYGKTISGFSSEAMKILSSHDYSGNVRELFNLVEQMVLFCRSEVIDVANLPDSLGATAPRNKRQRGCPDSSELRAALKRFQGNRSRVAQEFGVERTTLWRWMNRCGVE